MKKLLIYINPENPPPEWLETLCKLKVDNNLDLGWKKEDIILATNFKFEYNGVKAVRVRDDNYAPYCPVNSKFNVILELFDRGYIRSDKTYWFHDLDASQADIVKKSEIDLTVASMALADYGWREKWSTGSIFFTRKARDIFEAMVITQDILGLQDERALMLLTGKFSDEEIARLHNSYEDRLLKHIPKIADIGQRIKKINISYNFHPVVNLRECYEMALKPIKVVHFHHDKGFPSRGIPNLLDYFMYGKNELSRALMPERLIKIYQHHGIK